MSWVEKVLADQMPMLNPYGVRLLLQELPRRGSGEHSPRRMDKEFELGSLSSSPDATPADEVPQTCTRSRRPTTPPLHVLESKDTMNAGKSILSLETGRSAKDTDSSSQRTSETDPQTAECSIRSHSTPSTPPHQHHSLYYQPVFDKANVDLQRMLDKSTDLVTEDGSSLAERLDRGAPKSHMLHPPVVALEGTSHHTDDSTRFTFKNLPESVRNKVALDPIAAARMVLPPSPRSNSARLAALSRFATREIVRGSGGSETQGSGERENGPSPDSESGEESNADFTYVDWLENAGNKKKRKSTRFSTAGDTASGNLEGGLAEWSESSGHCVPSTVGHQGGTIRRNGTCSCCRISTEGPLQKGDRDDVEPVPRVIHPKPRFPISSRQRRILRFTVKARYRFLRAARARQRAQHQNPPAESAKVDQLHGGGVIEGKPGNEALPEKRAQKRLTKAERRAQALRSASGAPKISSIAAIKARAGQASVGVTGLPSPNTPSAAGAKSKGSAVMSSPQGGHRAQTKEPELSNKLSESKRNTSSADAPVSPSSSSVVQPPSGPFVFACASPIAARLATMRAEVEMLQSKLADTLKPIDDAVAAAANALAKMDAGDESAGASAAAALQAAKIAMPYPRSNSNSVGVAASHAQIPSAIATSHIAPLSPLDEDVSRPRGSPRSSGNGEGLPKSGKVSPAAESPSTSPPKMSRRRKANLNNVHHRANYIPSRVPFDPLHSQGHSHHAPASDSAGHSGLDHPATTCSLFPDEWMCIFCEYEMFYGEPPLMLRACKNRKKLVTTRKRAQARAHKAAAGGRPGSPQPEDNLDVSKEADNADNAGAQLRKQKKGRRKKANIAGSNAAGEDANVITSKHIEHCSCGKPISHEPPAAGGHSRLSSPDDVSASNGLPLGAVVPPRKGPTQANAKT